MQRRVDRELALGDVEHAEHIDVQLDDRKLFVREQGRELTEEDEPHGHRQLEEDADLGGDDAQRRAPRDQRHRSEHEPVARGREDRLEVGDDPIGVADQIPGESTESATPDLMPRLSASTSMVRFTAMRPPTPSRVKPKPSAIDGISALIEMRSECPSCRRADGW